MANTYVITGCAGFLGSNLVERMLSAGHQVVGLIDNLSMGRLDNLAGLIDDPRFRFVRSDVTEVDTLGGLEVEADAIVHLAASIYGGMARQSIRSRLTTAARNARSNSRVVSAANMVLASTSDVYGRNPVVPFSEGGSDSVIGSSKVPRWGYAVSKLFDEHFAFAYQDAYGFPV